MKSGRTTIERRPGWRNPHAVELGRKGGAATSPAKTAAARANGAKGGRPRKLREAGEADPEDAE